MRKLLLATIALAFVAVFGATSCTNGTLNNQAVATVAQDVSIIANGLKAALPQLAAATKMQPDQLALVTKAIDNLQSVSASVSSAATTSQALPLVQQVENDVNAVVGALALVPGLPQNIGLTLAAAQVLLPVVETAVGMIAPPTPKAIAMTPAEARAILIGQAAR